MNKVLCTLLLPPFAFLHGYDVVTEVEQADKGYRQAMNAREVVVLERLLTEDFLFIRRTGEIWDKKALVENIKAGTLVSDVQEKDLKTRIYGDTAILTHMDSIRTRDGAMVEMVATRVFVKQRGFWKLVSVQDTALPAR